MSCCGKIGEALKKVFKVLKPLLAVALVAFAGYLLWLVPAGATLGSVLAGVSWLPAALTTSTITATTAAYIALGAAVVIDSEGLGAAAGSVAKGVGTVAGKVLAGAAAGVAAGVSGGNNWLLYAALAAAAWYFLFRDEEDKETETESASPNQRKATTEETSAIAARNSTTKENSVTAGSPSSDSFYGSQPSQWESRNPYAETPQTN